MMGIYRIADLNIEIRSMHPYIQQMCRTYQTDGKADIAVCADQADIQREQEKDRAAAECSEDTQLAYSDAYLETLAVYRQIAERMPVYDTFLFHGSAITVDGAAYIFTAQSGTGKSTHARLWREMLIDRLKVKLYRLGCNMELNAAEVSYNAMKED